MEIKSPRILSNQNTFKQNLYQRVQLAKLRNAGLNKNYNSVNFGEEGLGAKQRSSNKNGSRSKNRNVMQSQNLSANMGGVIGNRQSAQQENSMDRGIQPSAPNIDEGKRQKLLKQRAA